MSERPRTTYEWDIETVADGDVIDHDHRDRLSEFDADELALALKGDGRALVLVRDVGSDAEGIVDRLWAYVHRCQLPEEFEDCSAFPPKPCGVRVPKRFHRELESLKRRACR